MKYRIYKVVVAEETTLIDENGNELAHYSLDYTDVEYYRVEIRDDGVHYDYEERFNTLEEAKQFIKEQA